MSNQELDDLIHDRSKKRGSGSASHTTPEASTQAVRKNTVNSMHAACMVLLDIEECGPLRAWQGEQAKKNRSPAEIQVFYACLAGGSILKTCAAVWAKLQHLTTLQGAGIYASSPFVPGTAMPSLYLNCQDERAGDLAELCLKLIGNRLLRTMWCWGGVPGCFALLGGTPAQQAMGLALVRRMDAAYRGCQDNTHLSKEIETMASRSPMRWAFPRHVCHLLRNEWLEQGSSDCL